MKNVCKKLFSLMLVAVMLVSIVPFSAMAASDEQTVWIHVYLEDENGNKTDAPNQFSEVTFTKGLPLGSVLETLGTQLPEGTFQRASVKGGGALGFKDPIPENAKGIYVVYPAPASTDGGDGGAGDNGGTPAPTKHYVTVGVKVNGEFTMPEKQVEISGETATAANLLKYKAENVSGDFVKYWTKSNGDSTDMNAAISEGDRIIFVFEKKAEPIKVVVKVNNSDNVVFTGYKVPANNEYALAEDLLTYAWSKDWDNVYSVDHAWSHDQQKKVGDDAKIYAGDTISFMLNPKNGSNNGGNNGSNGGTGNSKDMHEAYLKIYTWDGSKASTASLAKTLRIDQKGQIGYDGKISIGEKGDVRALVREYFVAKDSDGIGYDGLYIENGSNIYNWLTDSNKHANIDNLDELRKGNTTYISVFIDNAKLKNTGNADSSNPKTGDNIFIAVTFLAVSATALTGLYFYNKKRMVK